MKRALVVGSGPRVWQDVEAATQLSAWDAIYITNRAGVHWSDGHFIWVTLHPDRISKWRHERQQLERHSDYEIVVPLEIMRVKTPYRCVAYQWRIDERRATPSGSSGLFAVKVALDDGADRVVLAGMPMSFEPHFDGTASWPAGSMFRKGWIAAFQFYSRSTRSISGGWTQELLGLPTQRWLDGEDEDEIQLPAVSKKQFVPVSSRGSTQSFHREAAQRRKLMRGGNYESCDQLRPRN